MKTSVRRWVGDFKNRLCLFKYVGVDDEWSNKVGFRRRVTHKDGCPLLKAITTALAWNGHTTANGQYDLPGINQKKMTITPSLNNNVLTYRMVWLPVDMLAPDTNRNTQRKQQPIRETKGDPDTCNRATLPTTEPWRIRQKRSGAKRDCPRSLHSSPHLVLSQKCAFYYCKDRIDRVLFAQEQ